MLTNEDIGQDETLQESKTDLHTARDTRSVWAEVSAGYKGIGRGRDTHGDGWYGLRKVILMSSAISLSVIAAIAVVWEYQRVVGLARIREKFELIDMALWTLLEDGAFEMYGRVVFPNDQGPPDGRLPPVTRRDAQGNALWSWRVDLALVESAMEQVYLDVNYTQSWDAPSNRDKLQPFGALYSTYTYGELRRHPDIVPDTIALAITGPGTGFGCEGDEVKRRKVLPDQLILVVECRCSGIPWPEPGDLDIRTMPRTINSRDGKGISGRYGGFHVIFADSQLWFLSDKVPFEVISKFFTIEEAAKHDREVLLGPYCKWKTKGPAFQLR